MLDTRDLWEEYDAIVQRIEDAEDDGEAPPLEEDIERRDSLHELLHDIDPNKYGVVLIEEGREFEDYCEDMAYDVGYVERGSSISYYVDWEKWASDCAMDYTSVTFDGTDYYYRE